MSKRIKQKILVELIENEPDPKWLQQQKENEAQEASTESGQASSDSEEEEDPGEALAEELVYPYETTLGLLKHYANPLVGSSEDALRHIYAKLYRSLRYWQIKIPRWLIRRLE